MNAIEDMGISLIENVEIVGVYENGCHNNIYPRINPGAVSIILHKLAIVK